jgi:hypothetical protein
VQIPAAREEQDSGPATKEDGDGENNAAAGGEPGTSDSGQPDCREEPRSSSPTSPGGLTPPGSPTPSEPSTLRVRHPTAALRQRAEQEAGLWRGAGGVQRVGGNVLCGLHGGHVPCVRACVYKRFTREGLSFCVLDLVTCPGKADGRGHMVIVYILGGYSWAYAFIVCI